MSMNLLAFPCDADIAAHFLRRIDAPGGEALFLEKQRPALEPLLRAAGVRGFHVLKEEFYGKVTSLETAGTLERLAVRGFEQGLFPLNDFCGNVAIQLSAVAQRVTAVNATSVDGVTVELEPADENALPDAPYPHQTVREMQQVVVRLLDRGSSGEGADAEAAGERPTTGLLHNSPYDAEVLFRYVHAASVARGRVLEVGCGLGYGSYAVGVLNPGVAITAIDYDTGAIEFARRHFNHGPVTYEVGRGEGLPFADGTFDTVICYEVVEHVTGPGTLLAEIGRVLRTGGILVGSTPNHRLYAYRVNKERSGVGHEQLRRDGIWPWHLHELDEERIRALLASQGFLLDGFTYPTYVRGMDLHRRMRGMSCSRRVAMLLDQEDWSAGDFAASPRYRPLWSGFSFVFEATKE